MKNKSNFRTLLEILKTFLKIGSFTFGGGFAMIPLIEREFVENKKWIDSEEIVDIFAVSQTMPGAIGINAATFVGYKVAGKKGAIVATIGMVLPSFLIITLIAVFFSRFQNTPFVNAVFSGIRPAIVGLITMATLKVGEASIKDGVGMIIAALSIVAVVILDIQAVFVIVGGALVGLVIYYFFPNKVKEILHNGGDKK